MPFSRLTSDEPAPTPEELTASYLPRVQSAPTLEALEGVLNEIRRRCPDWSTDCPELYAAAVVRRHVLVGSPAGDAGSGAGPGDRA